MPHFKINRSVRYETWGNPKKAKELWFVLHGYGHLVPYFIRKFHVLNPDKYFVIAPEGLHRFYLKGFEGRVGASWMTKEDRLTDIADYVVYLDQLYEYVEKVYSADFELKRIFGFSQGGATATRWAVQGSAQWNALTLWASVVPEDLDWPIDTQKLNDLNISVVVGDDDEFVSYERLQKEIQFMTAKGIEFSQHRFQGKHDIPASALLEFTRQK